MRDIKVTNLIKFYAILSLLEAPSHGYELIKKIGEKLGRPVSAGQIYPFLKALKRRGLIEVRASGAREKKKYALTSEGRDFARRLLERFGGLVDIAVKPHLKVCTHCGCKVYEGGYIEVIKGRKLVFCCCHCAASYKKELK